jgi:hypothetical protein
VLAQQMHEVMNDLIHGDLSWPVIMAFSDAGAYDRGHGDGQRCL